jgi:DnaJ-class molecular chaperone
LQWHPDKVAEDQRADAAEKFKQIKEAYELLSDGMV